MSQWRDVFSKEMVMIIALYPNARSFPFAECPVRPLELLTPKSRLSSGRRIRFEGLASLDAPLMGHASVLGGAFGIQITTIPKGVVFAEGVCPDDWIPMSVVGGTPQMTLVCHGRTKPSYYIPSVNAWRHFFWSKLCDVEEKAVRRAEHFELERLTQTDPVAIAHFEYLRDEEIAVGKIIRNLHEQCTFP